MVSSHMFQHAYAHHPVEGEAAFWQVTIVHQLDRKAVAQAVFFDAVLKFFGLFFA